MIQEQTQSLYLTSETGGVFTNPFFLLATCFAAKPTPVASEIPLQGGGSVEVWISPDAYRQYASPYAYTPNPVNETDPDGNWVDNQDGKFCTDDGLPFEGQISLGHFFPDPNYGRNLLYGGSNLSEVGLQHDLGPPVVLAGLALRGGALAIDAASLQTVYRVSGGDALSFGKSWTPINPTTVANYRSAAGLPTGNTGERLIEATTRGWNISQKRSAFSLHGNPGGLSEYVLKNGGNVRVNSVQDVIPKF